MSLKKHIVFLFLFVIMAITGIDVIANRYFLDDFYYKYKEDLIYNVVEMLEDNMNNISDVEFLDELEKECNIQNISLVVIDAKGAPFITLFNKETQESLTKSLQKYLDIKTGENIIIRNTDSVSGINYIEAIGRFGNGYFYIIKTPIDSIRESTAIATLFLLYLLFILLPFMICVIVIIVDKITEPLNTLTAASSKISKLDFSMKYIPTGTKEIVELGKNFNIMSNELEKTIKQLRSANNELKKDLNRKEKTEEMRKEFLSSVSHELKTPIAIISGYSETLKDSINDPEDVQFFADTIYEETQKLSSMVQQILAINKMEYAETKINKVQFNLFDFIDSLITPLEKMIEDKKIILKNEISESIEITSDPEIFARIISNYLTNAIDHTPENGIIKIYYEKNELRIFNTGEKIPTESLERIWEKFYKIDKSRHREFGGTGLGLAIVKASAESLKEEVGVRNQSSGVEFFVTCQ